MNHFYNIGIEYASSRYLPCLLNALWNSQRLFAVHLQCNVSRCAKERLGCTHNLLNWCPANMQHCILAFLSLFFFQKHKRANKRRRKERERETFKKWISDKKVQGDEGTWGCLFVERELIVSKRKEVERAGEKELFNITTTRLTKWITF